jgi:hypothetical protein
VTDNVLELTSSPNSHHLVPPSSKHLARRRNALARRQDNTLANVQDDLLTVGGRVYMVNVTIAGQTYTLVIDTGSADTWVASTSFRCENPYIYAPSEELNCGFGALYNESAAGTFQPINYPFAVNYSGGEFLSGAIGTEDFGFGDGAAGRARVQMRQMIGVVDEGYWNGDGISSGLMGLGFPALAWGVNTGELRYTSALYTM